MFEKVIYDELYIHLNTYDIISKCQYSFRKHHATVLTAIELKDQTTFNINHNKTTFNIYIGMSKAFDSIDFTILLQKYYDIHNTSLKLIRSS